MVVSSRRRACLYQPRHGDIERCGLGFRSVPGTIIRRSVRSARRGLAPILGRAHGRTDHHRLLHKSLTETAVVSESEFVDLVLVAASVGLSRTSSDATPAASSPGNQVEFRARRKSSPFQCLSGNVWRGLRVGRVRRSSSLRRHGRREFLHAIRSQSKLSGSQPGAVPQGFAAKAAAESTCET